MRTVVFVDGYNLYYGVLRNTKLKWLDLYKLFAQHVLAPDCELLEVRYYTSPVLGRMCDSAQSPQRQRQYLQVLRHGLTGKVEVIEGKIVPSSPFLRLKQPIPQAPEVTLVQVHDFTEKKTDVNLAADLICGAWEGSFDQAVLCSNDSDLEAALSSVRRCLPRVRLGLVAPVPKGDARHLSKDLARQAHWSKTLSLTHIEQSQFPPHILGTRHCKPDAW